MGVVHDLAAAGKPKTAAELSSSCGGDELLIGKLTIIQKNEPSDV
jgi:hypothetical protein